MPSTSINRLVFTPCGHCVSAVYTKKNFSVTLYNYIHGPHARNLNFYVLDAKERLPWINICVVSVKKALYEA
jgi:hypothetical protein